MRNDIYKKFRAKGYEASEALKLARIDSSNYDLGNMYDYLQDEQVVDVPELADGYEIKLECSYEDNGEAPWDFGESCGKVDHVVSMGHLGNGNVELWLGGRNSYNFIYAWQDAIRNVRKEFDEYRPKWGKTQRQDYALERVRSEHKWFRDYCRDDWAYIWVKATLLFNGEEVSEDSIGAVESNDWEYCAQDLIKQLVVESKARTYAGSTVGCV
jgi:hypothetical protein